MAGEYVTSHRAITELLRDGERARRLLIAGSSKTIRNLESQARRAGVPVDHVSHDHLTAIAQGASDCALQVALSDRSSGSLDDFLEQHQGEQELVLILDHVVDPQNLGAILRSADQFAVGCVVLPERRAAPITAAVVQASAGTASHVEVFVEKNLARAVQQIQRAGYFVYAAEMDGEAIHATNLTGRTAIVMGGEGPGVSRLLLERSDARVAIPIHGHADSLNVSVACGIMLYEVRRQQGWLDAPSGT